jgi:hypothetical protein
MLIKYNFNKVLQVLRNLILTSYSKLSGAIVIKLFMASAYDLS